MRSMVEGVTPHMTGRATPSVGFAATSPVPGEDL